MRKPLRKHTSELTWDGGRSRPALRASAGHAARPARWCWRSLIEPPEESIELARIEASTRFLKDAARLINPSRPCEGMDVRSNNLGVVALRLVSGAEPVERFRWLSQRDVEQMS